MVKKITLFIKHKNLWAYFKTGRNILPASLMLSQ